MVSPTRTYGWLCLTNKLGLEEFDDEDERLAGILGAQLGRMYENGKLYRELQARTVQLEHEIAERRRSEARFRALIENASDLIAVLGADGTTLYASPSHQRILGIPPEELEGREALSRVHPEDRPSVLAALEETKAASSPITLDLRLAHRDGSWRVMEAVASNLLSNSAIQGVIVNSRDVTDRRRAEERSQALLRVADAVARAGTELIGALDRPGLLDRVCAVMTDVVDCDVSWTLLRQGEETEYTILASAGMTPEEQEELRLLRLAPAAASALFGELLRSEVVQLDPADSLAHFDPLPGHFGWNKVLYVPLLRGGEVIGALAAAHRVPGERFSQVAEQIASRLAHLASLALEVGRLIETLEEANRLKSDFVATISHELRTPMNIIMGYNELLGEEAFGPLTADQRRVLRAMSRSANQLLELINSTLDLSRLEAGRLPLSLANVDPAELLRALREDIGAPERAAVRLVWKLPRAGAAVRTDAVKLKVIVKNLVQNALKFTREGMVTVRVRRRRGGLEIEVADTGIGIEPSALPVIFESFRQLEPSVTRHHGGVGLGLYIVRRMVDLLDGTIDVDSTPGRGSTFSVWLPSAPG